MPKVFTRVINLSQDLYVQPAIDMKFFLYRLLTIVLSPVILGHVLWKAYSNRDRRYLRQRLGLKLDTDRLPECVGKQVGNQAGSQAGNRCLWFHCASVGEVNTLLPLLRHIHQQRPGQHFIITTNTITGASIVRRQQLAYVHHIYLPFDWSYSVRRFLRRVRPCALYIMETEIWPNLIRHCRRHDIPVRIINGRLSSKTMSASGFVKGLLAGSLQHVTYIASRSEQDTAAWLALGAQPDTVETVGNLKLTTAMQSDADTDDFTSSRDYVLLASTHDDEDRQFFDVWNSLKRDELLIIAPRHPERADSIIRQIKSIRSDVTFTQRSKGEMPTHDTGDDTDVFLLDTVGELKNYFANAKLVIMGGSFVAVGGHNILEPASYGCAIITGPYMENFSDELALMKDNDAIVQVDDMQQMSETLKVLLDDDAKRQVLADNTEKVSQDVSKLLDDYAAIVLGA
jgi:3-deoxy-D-manno-octulosonic-acid transferase